MVTRGAPRLPITTASLIQKPNLSAVSHSYVFKSNVSPGKEVNVCGHKYFVCL